MTTDRVRAARTKASTPADSARVAPESVDVEAWQQVGDPLADELLAEVRRRGRSGGDLLATARELRAEGVEVAEAFLTDVESAPVWADFDAMEAGSRMALRHPIGLLYGLHGALPFTYIDAATTRVMASTGRLTRPGVDFRRRFFETSAAFVGALDVEAMRPGRPRWEEWVRVRLLHAMVRAGIERSGRWDPEYGAPINQAAIAAGAHIFGPYRVQVIRFFGGRVSVDEELGFGLMWRWIARLQGAHAELLGQTPAEQLRLAERIQQALYHPTEDSRAVAAAMLDGLATMRDVFPFTRSVHAAIVGRLLGPEMLTTLPGRDVPADLGLRDGRGSRWAGPVVGLNRGLARLVARAPVRPARRRGRLDQLLESEIGRARPTYLPGRETF